MKPVAIVTGANRGIGAETARALVNEGFDLALAVRNPDSATELADELRQSGAEAIVVSCDVSAHAEVKSMVDTTLAKLGRIDVLVNNAGSLEPIGLIEETDPDLWLQCLQVNLTGVYFVIREVLPHFRNRGNGVIVNLSSGAAFRPLRGWSAYCTSKAGLSMLTRAVAEEVSETDIRVYGFQPGMVDTRMTQEGLKKKVNILSEKKAEDFFRASEPAAAIAMLCHHRPMAFHGGESRYGDEEMMAWLNSLETGQ
jgi:3-oxoacyl-[acyl-carrier protein] reductase